MCMIFSEQLGFTCSMIIWCSKFFKFINLKEKEKVIEDLQEKASDLQEKARARIMEHLNKARKEFGFKNDWVVDQRRFGRDFEETENIF